MMETLLLRQLLELTPGSLDSLEPWWHATRDVREAHATTADRALIGGVLLRVASAARAARREAAWTAIRP